MKPNHKDIDHILVSEEQLKAKVAELGAQISRDYAGRDLLMVSILKGAVVFMADLMRAVTIPCAIDFMVVSSYGGANTSSTGLVKIIKDLDQDLTGKDVLIVEDILDTGITLSNLVPMLQLRNPRSVRLCTILSKPSRRKAEIEREAEEKRSALMGNAENVARARMLELDLFAADLYESVITEKYKLPFINEYQQQIVRC